MELAINALKAANLFSSTEEVRYYLNGVLFEIENGKLQLVATDGHRAIIIPCGFYTDQKQEDTKFIIPRQLLERIKIKRGVEKCYLSRANGKITIEYDDATYTGDEIDGTFPDYRRVFPNIEEIAAVEIARRKKLTAKERAEKYAEEDGCFEIGFNPKFLADFAKLNETLGFKGAGVRLQCTDPKAPTIITMGGALKETYTAVLMPMRV